MACPITISNFWSRLSTGLLSRRHRMLRQGWRLWIQYVNRITSDSRGLKLSGQAPSSLMRFVFRFFRRNCRGSRLLTFHPKRNRLVPRHAPSHICAQLSGGDWLLRLGGTAAKAASPGTPSGFASCPEFSSSRASAISGANAVLFDVALSCGVRKPPKEKRRPSARRLFRFRPSFGFHCEA
jgi:hypothetical protein